MTTSPVSDTWFCRELPVLTSIAARVENHGSAERADVLSDTGLDERGVDTAIHSLQQAGYCSTYFDGGNNWGVMEITERTRRELGIWPTAESLTSRIITALERVAENTAASPDRRTASRRILDAATGDGRAALATALGNVMSSPMTGG